MQSNYNGIAILKKKSYSVGLLIVLIILFFPAAIVYYLVASDDVVTIRNTNVQPSSNNTNVGTTTESFDSYCVECGHGLFKDSKFCPGCGRKLSVVDERSVETVSEETDDISIDNDSEESEEDDILKCVNCGTELTEENIFCPECGKKVIETDAE